MNQHNTDFWVDTAKRMREADTERAVREQYWRNQLRKAPRRSSRWRSIATSIMGLFL